MKNKKMRDSKNDFYKSTKENLGQVFTSSKIAQLMALLLFRKGTGSKVLDPCVGSNVLLKAISKNFPDKKLILEGVEIDTSSLDKKFFKKSGRKLTVGNFFSFPIQKKYDYIIMNPPYVRHEQLNKAKINNKNKILKSLNPELRSFNGRSNLYVYFFLKAYRHLNPGGRIAAICYDSWLYSEFGENFKSFLNTYFKVDSIIHFKHSAFDNAEVGATIIELTEKTKADSEPTWTIQLHDKDSLPYLKNNSDLSKFITKKSFIFKPHDDRCPETLEPLKKRFDHIRRGVETLGNKFFYFSDAPNGMDFLKPIVKNVKSIKTFKIGEPQTKKVLFIGKNNSELINKKTRTYINDVTRKILNEKNRYSSLKKAIKNNPEGWFIMQPYKPGNLLFNYYLRDKVDFILNPKNYLASNNFYVLNSTTPYLDLALLNSYITKRSILSRARNQGKGLKKVQIYEFKDALIPKKSIFESKDIKTLEKLGASLADCERGKENDIIKEIDKIVLSAINKPRLAK